MVGAELYVPCCTVALRLHLSISPFLSSFFLCIQGEENDGISTSISGQSPQGIARSHFYCFKKERSLEIIWLFLKAIFTQGFFDANSQTDIELLVNIRF